MRSRERGATLVVALVILLLLAFFGLSAYHTSLTDMKASGNMQARTEALNAAQEAIETAISTAQFFTDPANALQAPCGAPNTFCVDYNGDGLPEYIARLVPSPACMTKKVISVVELNLADAEDLGCAVGQAQNFGIAGAGNGDSLCANTVWQVTAEASAPASGAKVTVSQGVGIRIGIDDMTSACL